jgi:hypothetical protein
LNEIGCATTIIWFQAVQIAGNNQLQYLKAMLPVWTIANIDIRVDSLGIDLIALKILVLAIVDVDLLQVIMCPHVRIDGSYFVSQATTILPGRALNVRLSSRSAWLQ